jgi:hypothetical protein
MRIHFVLEGYKFELKFLLLGSLIRSLTEVITFK